MTSNIATLQDSLPMMVLRTSYTVDGLTDGLYVAQPRVVTQLAVAKMELSQAKYFHTLSELENFCVKHILDNSKVIYDRAFLDSSNSQTDHFVGTSLSIFTINIAALSVAKTSRRGRGNIILHSTSYDEKLQDSLIQFKLGKNEQFHYIEDARYVEAVPSDVLIVMYERNNKSQIGVPLTIADSAFSYFKNENGYYLFHDELSALYAAIIPI